MVINLAWYASFQLDYLARKDTCECSLLSAIFRLTLDAKTNYICILRTDSSF